jgi:hypothetical protein
LNKLIATTLDAEVDGEDVRFVERQKLISEVDELVEFPQSMTLNGFESGNEAKSWLRVCNADDMSDADIQQIEDSDPQT